MFEFHYKIFVIHFQILIVQIGRNCWNTMLGTPTCVILSRSKYM